MVEPFIKYDIGGAYHWYWYLLNFDKYRGFTNSILKLHPNPSKIVYVGSGDGLISYLFFGYALTFLDLMRTKSQFN